MKNQIEERTNQ